MLTFVINWMYFFLYQCHYEFIIANWDCIITTAQLLIILKYKNIYMYKSKKYTSSNVTNNVVSSSWLSF